VDNRVLIDTGPMVALFSEQDAHHRGCRDALAAIKPPMLTCWPVVTEAAWLLRTRPGTLQELLGSFDAGLFALLPLDGDDLPAIAALMKRYESAAIQLADAALAHLAE
jgi:predicted nucleic acid-binding protein